jgi:selenocysteine lyase/cysteine desulfurase
MCIDRRRLRADTAACERVTHLNNAGAGLPPRQVTDRVVEHLRLEEEVGGYEAADRVRAEWADGRSALAELVGGTDRNLAVVESTTAGFHKVLATVPLRRGDRILVAGSEYASTVLPLLQLSRRQGIRVEFLADEPDGGVDVRALAHRLDTDVRMVCAVHSPSHNGLVNDVAGIGRVLAEADIGAWYVVDACQSWGQLPVDAAEFGCDFLLASGRKFMRGPRGTGVMYVGDRALRELEAFPLDIRGARWTGPLDYTVADSAQRFESFERSVATGLGLMAAARYLLDIGVAATAEAIGRNAEYLRSRLSGLPGWEVLDRGQRRSGIVVARHTRADPAALAARLRAEGVNTHPVATTTNPRDLGTRPALRLSPHAFNNQADLDRALDLLAALTR